MPVVSFGVFGVLGVLPGLTPLGESQAERDEIPDGASDERRARPATVMFGTGCGIGVPCGIVPGDDGRFCGASTTVACALLGVGVTLMPGMVGRFAGCCWPTIVALICAFGLP